MDSCNECDRNRKKTKKGHKNISNVQIEHEEELYCGIDCF